jgi:hypothetical protein
VEQGLMDHPLLGVAARLRARPYEATRLPLDAVLSNRDCS